MSLINDMLRDLDAKRPDDPARRGLQREVRSLPPTVRKTSFLARLALLAGLPALGVAAAWLHLNGQLLPLLGANAGAPTAALPAPPAVPLPSTALRPAESLALVPGPAESLLPVPDPLAPKPAPTVPAVESRAPAAATLAVPSAPPATVVPPAPLAPPPAATNNPLPPAVPVKIEKVPAATTPRERAELEFHRAEAALAAGRSGEAGEALAVALKQDPTHVPARQLLLRQLLEQRKTAEVMTLLQEGLELLPQQTGWAMSLARLQFERGDPTAADATLVRSQSFAEASADYVGFMGNLKSRLGEPRQAIPLYARATRLAPDDGRWWLGLGLAQEADGRQQDARESLRRALATGRLSAELGAVAEQHLR